MTVVNAKDFGAIRLVFTINTEPDFLTFNPCDLGEISQGSILDCNYDFLQSMSDGTNVYKYTLSLATTSGISGAGNIAYLNFKYNPSFAGTKTVMISPSPNDWGDVFDLGGQHVTWAVGGNVYYVGAPDSSTDGDVNGDKVVNSMDALMAIQMTTGKRTPSTAGDMDKNGNVEVNDALLILQKAALMGAAGAGGGTGGGRAGRVGGVMSLNPSSDADLPKALKTNYEALIASPQLQKASPQLQKASPQLAKGGVQGGVAQDQQQAQQLAKGQQAAQNQQVAQAGKVG